MFIPDYTATVKEDCTYIEFTVADYINGFKSSLMLKDRE